MRRLLRRAVILLAVSVGTASLAAGPQTIAPKDAASHANQTVTVVGTLDDVHKTRSNMIFLDMGGRYPNNPFSAVVFARDADRFGSVFGLKGKKAAITGKIEIYKNRPEIVLHTPDQVKPAK